VIVRIDFELQYCEALGAGSAEEAFTSDATRSGGNDPFTRDYRDAYVMQGIQGLIWLAGYRLLVSHLVVFDRASSVRSKNSIGLTGIDLQSPQGCLNRPNLVVAEVEIVPT
jgi:hypothetical protein